MKVARARVSPLSFAPGFWMSCSGGATMRRVEGLPMSTYKCAACDRQVEVKRPTRHVPVGWRMVPLEGKVYQLCDGCNDGSYGDKISPGLREAFERKGIKFAPE